MLVAGVDDSGRGCVIGPLVIAGVLIEKDNVPELIELGVKDSKLLSSQRRRELAVKIKRIALKYGIIELSPVEIDEVVRLGKRLHRLNRLEAQAMARIIEALKPDVVYVDASDIKEKRFADHISELLTIEAEIVSEHKADRKYPIVSAASIVAKVERDREIRDLTEKYGDFGCGYPTDPKTTSFLRRYLERFGRYPDDVRKSWKTARRIKSIREPIQGTLI